jgi:lactate dehydrogenase-like 2-hydroxyacid dehydrogenase
MFNIVYPDARFLDNGDIERSMVGDINEIVLDIFHEQLDSCSVVPTAILAKCDALVVYHKVKVNELLLGRMPRCRLIVRAGVGLNNIDVKTCTARGIPVCNVPHYGTQEVADHTIALLLTLVRGTLAFNERLRADPIKGWRFGEVSPIRRIYGSVLGIAGLGRIGAAVAERAVGFGMKVIYFGGKQHSEFERVHSFDELLGRSEILSLHLPLTETTHGLIDERAISLMKPGVILINTARGPLIDTAAVYAGLRNGQLAAAGLDVLPTEPPDLKDPLISAWTAGEDWIRDRLVITPHAAFFSLAGFLDLRRSSMDTVLSFLRDGRLHNCVNERDLAKEVRS